MHELRNISLRPAFLPILFFPYLNSSLLFSSTLPVSLRILLRFFFYPCRTSTPYLSHTSRLPVSVLHHEAQLKITPRKKHFYFSCLQLVVVYTSDGIGSGVEIGSARRVTIQCKSKRGSEAESEARWNRSQKDQIFFFRFRFCFSRLRLADSH